MSDRTKSTHNRDGTVRESQDLTEPGEGVGKALLKEESPARVLVPGAEPPVATEPVQVVLEPVRNVDFDVQHFLVLSTIQRQHL